MKMVLLSDVPEVAIGGEAGAGFVWWFVGMVMLCLAAVVTVWGVPRAAWSIAERRIGLPVLGLLVVAGLIWGGVFGLRTFTASRLVGIGILDGISGVAASILCTLAVLAALACGWGMMRSQRW